MSLTPTDHHYHRIYEAASGELSDLIDDSYSALVRHIRLSASPVSGYYLRVSNDDRAEALIAAITRYVVESNPNHPAVIAALEAAAKED